MSQDKGICCQTLFQFVLPIYHCDDVFTKKPKKKLITTMFDKNSNQVIKFFIIISEVFSNLISVTPKTFLIRKKYTRERDA